MADSFDDAEFWLPSQFLSDDDWLIEKEYMKTVADQKGLTKDVFGVPYDFPADLSSPVETASTETESDEDDYSFLAGLTHQMAHSTLHADDRSSLGYESHKVWPSKPVSRSPQSTLCQARTGCKVCSASPQATWDLLYAAAGEVAKMKLDEEVASYGSHLSGGHLPLGPTRNNFVPSRSTTHSPSDIAIYHKLQALQFEQLRQQQLLKRQTQQQRGAAWGVQGGSRLYQNHQSYRGRSLSDVAGGSFRPGLISVSQARQQQKHSGSGMQSVFLGNQPAKRERTGTGVFIPHRAGTPAVDTRNKSGGSNALLPARVVQALNLNLNELSGSQHVHPRLPAYNDGVDLRLRSSDFLGGSHGDQSFRTQQPMSSREVGLPQEWTY